MRFRWWNRQWNVKSTLTLGLLTYICFYCLGLVVFNIPSETTKHVAHPHHIHRAASSFKRWYEEPSKNKVNSVHGRKVQNENQNGNASEVLLAHDVNSPYDRNKLQAVVRNAVVLKANETGLKSNVTKLKRNQKKSYRSVNGFRVQSNYSFFSQDYKLEDGTIRNWLNRKTEFCESNIIAYANKFVYLKNVLVDPNFSFGPKGGEDIKQVLNQDEKKEYLHLKPSYFNVMCNTNNISYNFDPKDHLNSWLKSINFTKKLPQTDKKYEERFTIAVQRYEYVNLYHTMTDYYNVFLMLMIFKQSPNNTIILWVDSHPKGGLDEVWNTLFGTTIRAGQLKFKILFKNLIWAMTGYFSPLNMHDKPRLPYIEEFRTFFLTQHQIKLNKELKCSGISVLFIFRRDYIAHPRNPRGHVSRKIKNEDELMNGVRKLLPGHEVIGIQTDNLTMTKQLQYITKTDILIGMHGAGLSHTLFLPKHAGLVELYPTYWPMANKHFRAMAAWRGLHYSSWQNNNPANELSRHYTIIPVDTVVAMVDEMYHKLCGQHPTSRK